jgi:sugar phosphate isomerase/epimerase
MGAIEMKDYTDKLKDLVGRGEKDTPKYQKLCAEADAKRTAKKEKFCERAWDSLRKFLPDAEARGLKLGIENREAVEEIPIEGDYPLFFHEFTSPSVCYWHDTGHAQIKENLGFIHHAMHLEALSDRLAGFHIHDVQFPGKDHCMPGSGMIDFAALKPMVKPHHIKVFEFSPSLTPEQVKTGVDYVKGIWGKD